VVITGASAGIGRAVARAFGAQGARVALLARGQERLLAAAREIRALGGDALAIPTDVADWQQVEAAAQQVEREWGAIDVWINNAMVTVFSPFTEIAPEDYRRVTEVTYQEIGRASCRERGWRAGLGVCGNAERAR